MPQPSDKFRTSRDNLGATVVRKGSRYDTEGKDEAATIMRKDPSYDPDLAQGVGDLFMSNRLRADADVSSRDRPERTDHVNKSYQKFERGGMVRARGRSQEDDDSGDTSSASAASGGGGAAGGGSGGD